MAVEAAKISCLTPILVGEFVRGFLAITLLFLDKFAMIERGHVENAVLLSLGIGILLEPSLSLATLEAIVRRS